MDDALVGSAAAEAPALGLHARDVLLDPADGDGPQPRGARAHLQDDQRRDAVDVRLGLSALGHGSALDHLRPAVPLGAGEAQHPRPQRQARLQPRAGDVRGEDQAPREPRRGGVTGNYPLPLLEGEDERERTFTQKSFRSPQSGAIWLDYYR